MAEHDRPGPGRLGLVDVALLHQRHPDVVEGDGVGCARRHGRADAQFLLSDLSAMITDRGSFIENEDLILKGDFHHSLLEKCKYEAQINDIIKLSVEKIYQNPL